MGSEPTAPFNAASQKLFSPWEVAQKSVRETRELAGADGQAVLAMGEIHPMFSHQVTQVLALKELAAQGKNVTLFMEYPHNRLYTVLLDRGYDPGDALKLSERIAALDSDGHLTAKALIGGNPQSLRGGAFANFESQMLLQAAISQGTKIVYADAARVYPDDFCMDFSDARTRDIGASLNARPGAPGACGPDDMLIRNTCMAQTIKAELDKNGGIGLLATGAAHCLGIADENNGLHHYKDSLARRFEEQDLPAVMLSMPPQEALPPDYQAPAGRQIHLLDKPGPVTLIDDMSDPDIESALRKNNLDPDRYDPRKFALSYRTDFERVLKQAESEMGIKAPAEKAPKTPPPKAFAAPPV